MDVPAIKSTNLNPKGSRKINRRNMAIGAGTGLVGGALAGSVMTKKAHIGGRIGGGIGAVAGAIEAAYRKTQKNAKEFEVGRVVGRALVRGKHEINLSARLAVVGFGIGDKTDKLFKEANFDDYHSLVGKNFNSRQNAYGGKSPIGHVLQQAEMGAKVTGDIYDAVKSGSLNHKNFRPRAEVGNFKITPESRNTARVTVGNDRRERRGKYEWEKVGTQRKLAIAGLAASAVITHKVGKALRVRGGGDMKTGAINVARSTKNRLVNAGIGIKHALVGKNKTSPKYRTFEPTLPPVRSDTNPQIVRDHYQYRAKSDNPDPLVALAENELGAKMAKKASRKKKPKIVPLPDAGSQS